MGVEPTQRAVGPKPSRLTPRTVATVDRSLRWGHDVFEDSKKDRPRRLRRRQGAASIRSNHQSSIPGWTHRAHRAHGSGPRLALPATQQSVIETLPPLCASKTVVRRVACRKDRPSHARGQLLGKALLVNRLLHQIVGHLARKRRRVTTSRPPPPPHVTNASP